MPDAPRATPIADSIGQPPTGPVPTYGPDELPGHPATDPGPADQESPAQWTPDITAITTAHGDPTIWAKQFYELVGYTTGKWIDQQSLEEWLNSFAAQVQTAVFRSVFFDLANTVVPADTKGDPALELLQFRDDVARGFRVRGGL